MREFLATYFSWNHWKPVFLLWFVFALFLFIVSRKVDSVGYFSMGYWIAEPFAYWMYQYKNK